MTVVESSSTVEEDSPSSAGRPETGSSVTYLVNKYKYIIIISIQPTLHTCR